MYTELINKINPKPKFNLRWYKNEDLYSEGEIEDVIVKLIAENEPEKYVQAITKKFSWSTYYHLTHIRKNILNWYPFDKNSSVLEVGCGMGAITSVLCERCKKVTAVELSRKRATGTLLRCREKENLEIIVGNLNDIEFEEKFDYITLIGVLEYQGSYTDTEDPYADFLIKIRSLLKPTGKLLIAIENQYGLKYWCGAREDHTSLPFDGINQYLISNRKVRTFSKAGLEELVRKSGFEKVFFYYPMPDYKMPTVIYSQDCLPHNSNMMNMQYYYVPNSHTMVACEKNIYKDVIKNNVFEFFSNSFLVECTETGEVGEVTFSSLSCKRFPEYQVGTKFTNKGKVEKFALVESIGQKHIRQILKNESELKNNGIHIWESEMQENKLVSSYTDALTMEDILLEAYQNRDIEEIYRIWDCVYEEILKSSKEVSWEENSLFTLGIGTVSDKEKYGPILKKGYIDMILRNAFWIEDKVYWFDQEWVLENIPAKFIIYRALVQFYISYEEAADVLLLSELAKKYELLFCWKEFQKVEELFINAAVDKVHLTESNSFMGNTLKECQNSISRLLK